MDDKQTTKFIGYAILAIIAYGILQMIIPYLIFAIVGLVAWRVFQEFRKHK